MHSSSALVDTRDLNNQESSQNTSEDDEMLPEMHSMH